MQQKYLWKIGGEAGFGIMTTGILMSKIATRSGYHIFSYSEYPSLIRGGHNTVEVAISPEPVYATRNPIDLLVCLNKDTYVFHKHRLHENSLVLFDDGVFTPDGTIGKFLALPIKKMLLEDKIPSVMGNMLAVGASLGLMGADEKIYQGLITETFLRKGQEVVDSNLKVMAKGMTYMKEHYGEHVQSILPKEELEKLLVLTGNDAFSLASVAADCRLYSAYPMTPASTVLTTLAGLAEKVGMVVRHAEDEISVINTALGSYFAGVRSSVGTSGGGFALMVESLSFAGVAELPIVVFLSQRPGPATGMPTWTEQGDLLFAVNGGHGDFPKIVLAPGDIEEMVELTLKAFNLADIYQTPIIVMSDKLLSESHKDLSYNFWDKLTKAYVPDRGKIIHQPKAGEPYLRYQVSEDGISPMLIPSAKGTFYQANSYEHLADTHTTEDMKVRIEQATKRAKKTETYLQKHFEPPRVFGDLDQAEIVFVSWGGNKGAILEAQKALQDEGTQTAYIHFTHVFPLDAQKLEPLFKTGKRYILVENNQSGQFGRLLRGETGIHIEDKFLKFDGQPIFVEELVEYVKNEK